MSVSRPILKNHKRKRTESYGLGDFEHAGALRPVAGDLIEIDRTLFTDWALFIGNGKLVHVQGSTKNELGIPVSGRGIVRVVNLVDACGTNLARINNKEVPAKERHLKPLASNLVVSNALKCIGKVVNYNLLSRNCEHFVTEWKYGKGWSDQAKTALSSNGHVAGQKDRCKGHAVWLNQLTTMLNSPHRSGTTCGVKSSKRQTSRVTTNHLRHTTRH